MWLVKSRTEICRLSEIGPLRTLLALRTKLKLYMGQFQPGGALKGTTEINVLECLCAHLEALLLFGTAGGLARSPTSHSSVELETLKMPATSWEGYF